MSDPYFEENLAKWKNDGRPLAEKLLKECMTLPEELVSEAYRSIHAMGQEFDPLTRKVGLCAYGLLLMARNGLLQVKERS